MISAVVRGTEQKLTISLCLLDNDTFLVSECLSSLIKCVDPPSALAIELDDMGKGLVDRKYMITERVHTPPVHRGI